MDYYQFTKISYNMFFQKILKWLVKGIGVTFITSLIIKLSNIVNVLAFMQLPMLIIFSIVEIILVIVLVKKLEKLDYKSATFYFYIYSIINGITLSFVLSYIDSWVSVLAFAITFCYFGLLYTITKYTDHDFIGVGKICIAALPILCIMYFILLFFHAPMMHFVVVVIDLIVFSGLTLYDLKKIERMYYSISESEIEVCALLCALELYLDFINILLDIIMLIADSN